MPRLPVLAASLLIAGAAAAQCPPWYPYYPVYPVVPPAYPLTPAVWGAPAPKPLPPAPPPYVPKKSVPSIKEEDEPAPARPAEKPKNGAKGGVDEKGKESPRIPRTRLPIPGDHLDKGVPDVPKGDKPKAEEPKKEIPPAKRVEQYVIPTEGRGEPPAQVKVGFFNHSDRDLVLDVNGDPLKLPKEQYVTVRLPRTFTWAEKGAKGKNVVVPPDADGIEIVFRR